MAEKEEKAIRIPVNHSGNAEGDVPAESATLQKEELAAGSGDETPTAGQDPEAQTADPPTETRADSLSPEEQDAAILRFVHQITPEDRQPLEYVQELVDERQRLQDQLLRTAADLENFRKRMQNERSRLLKYKNEDALRDFLPVVDNMERALQHVSPGSENDAFVEGVRMIVAMCHALLEKYEVQPVAAVGQTFDPSVHEAIAHVPTSDHAPNTVMDEVEKGYTYQDRLLRPAKVAVAGPLPEAT